MKKLLLKIIATGLILGVTAFGVSQVDVEKTAGSEDQVKLEQAFDPIDGGRP